MPIHEGLPIKPFKTRTAFETWLRDNHANVEDGLWIKFAKKATGLSTVTYEEAREVAIIYGWIDGLRHALDERYYAIRFTPRRPRSKWSQINRDIAEDLIKRRKMRAAGKREVDAAKKDGRWEMAYAGQRTMEIPADLRRALDESASAKKNFAALSAANRYAILHAIYDAKRETTRQRRIEKFVGMLERGESLHPDR